MEKSVLTNQEMQDLVALFGLVVDYNQWEVEGKNWARIKSLDWPEEFGNINQCLILYREDGKEINIEELRFSLIRMGEKIKAKEIKKVLNIY